ncbi:MAG: DUF2829 domain-containing protein [Bacteroidales bacterium]|nr:DUF2829 domain-containing protein [Bacteroidales bacterium]
MKENFTHKENAKNGDAFFDSKQDANMDSLIDFGGPWAENDTLFLFDFGEAIRALKRGELVRRRGWNGKGMFLWLKPATKIKAEWCKDQILKKVIEDNGGDMDALGTICMKTADNKILTGWLASQTDMLSEDWETLAPEIFEWEKTLTEDDFVDFESVERMNENAEEKEKCLYDYIASEIKSAESADGIKPIREKMNIPSLTEDEKEIVERMLGVKEKKKESNA